MKKKANYQNFSVFGGKLLIIFEYACSRIVNTIVKDIYTRVTDEALLAKIS